jgi:hypothetical protein
MPLWLRCQNASCADRSPMTTQVAGGRELHSHAAPPEGPDRRNSGHRSPVGLR